MEKFWFGGLCFESLTDGSSPSGSSIWLESNNIARFFFLKNDLLGLGLGLGLELGLSW